MNILFVKGSSILSKAIIGATKEPCSHVALEFPELGIVVHSNLLGVHIEWAHTFRQHIQVIHVLKSLKPEDNDIIAENSKLDNLLDKYEWSWYDFGGLLFDGLLMLSRTYLKIPLPKTNLWQSSSMFMCTEWVSEWIDGKQDSMITPEGLYQKLKTSNDWVDV